MSVAVIDVEDLEKIIERRMRLVLDEKDRERATDEVMTREQVAKLLQVHADVVGRYVKTKGLPGRKMGGEWRFVRGEVLRWLASQKGSR